MKNTQKESSGREMEGQRTERVLHEEEAQREALGE